MLVYEDVGLAGWGGVYIVAAWIHKNTVVPCVNGGDVMRLGRSGTTGLSQAAERKP